MHLQGRVRCGRGLTLNETAQLPTSMKALRPSPLQFALTPAAALS